MLYDLKLIGIDMETLDIFSFEMNHDELKSINFVGKCKAECFKKLLKIIKTDNELK